MEKTTPKDPFEL
jgi:ABC-type glutathione transport system ATPase component